MPRLNSSASQASVVSYKELDSNLFSFPGLWTGAAWQDLLQDLAATRELLYFTRFLSHGCCFLNYQLAFIGIE